MNWELLTTIVASISALAAGTAAWAATRQAQLMAKQLSRPTPVLNLQGAHMAKQFEVGKMSLGVRNPSRYHVRIDQVKLTSHRMRLASVEPQFVGLKFPSKPNAVALANFVIPPDTEKHIELRTGLLNPKKGGAVGSVIVVYQYTDRLDQNHKVSASF